MVLLVNKLQPQLTKHSLLFMIKLVYNDKDTTLQMPLIRNNIEETTSATVHLVEPFLQLTSNDQAAVRQGQ
jgi:hypothetical protein